MIVVEGIVGRSIEGVVVSRMDMRVHERECPMQEHGKDHIVEVTVVGTATRIALVPASDRFSTRSSIMPTARSRSSRTQPDKEMYEIPGATHYYAGPDQRDKLRRAVDIVTDWLIRHDFASTE